MTVEVFIEGQKLDLFDDENISITQGVQDVKDISKLFADFSQSFNVPASNRNNAIFKNYYNQDINNGFDARTRKDGYLTVNTLPFKTGKIRLDGVKLKDNHPSSYKITFFGDIIKIKDRIGDDKLNTLDWLANFNHSYSDTIVQTGLTDGLDFTVDGVSYPRAVVYPLIAYQRQYMYNSNANDHTDTDTLVNIHYHNQGASHAGHGVDFKNLKPAIRLNLIIEAIAQKYDLNFVGGFFESQNFKDIFMSLNKSTESLANGYWSKEYTESVPLIVGINNLRFDWSIFPDAGFENIGYKIRATYNGTVIAESNAFLFGDNNANHLISNINEDVAEIKFEVITEDNFEFTANTKLNFTGYNFNSGAFATILFQESLPNQVIALESNILNEIKDIKTYDFLMGIFKTFNLVATSRNGNILVEDLPTWYSQGRIVDITKYVDTEKRSVDKGRIFNEMFFNFKESQQILADEFNQSNNRFYGNEDLTLYTDETQEVKLDGDKLEVKSIFENPIFERLTDQETGSQTTILYCPYFNREIKSISGNPFMFYALDQDVSNNTIGFIGSGTTYNELADTVIMPSHSRVIDTPSFNLNFASEFNEYTGQEFTNTIYDQYYRDYVEDIFSVKRRNFKFTAILPNSILNNLKLNDRLVIKNTRYIINKITSNLTNRKDELELINDIYDAPLATDVLRSSLFAPTEGNYPTISFSDTIQYFGRGGTVSLVDLGDRVDWVTIDNVAINENIASITFTLSENNQGDFRYAGIQVLDKEKEPIFYIAQEG
jgi:hypothetical protein